jgi:hypothetical protein
MTCVVFRENGPIYFPCTISLPAYGWVSTGRFAASDAFIFIFISEPSPSQLLQEQHRPPLYVESRSPVESYQKSYSI